jgi:methyl-accepting chemotaxis protein
MQRFRNLRLAGRLGLGFGALALALIAVAALASTRMGGLGDDVRRLDAKDLSAVDIAGRMSTRASTIAASATQHLYVYDGDLATEDEIAKEIDELTARNADAQEQLKRLLVGTPAAGSAEKFSAAWEKFSDATATAVERSRDETVRKVEERDGSRDFYVAEVVPAQQAVNAAGADLQGKVGETADAAVSGATSDAGAAQRLIIIVALLALAAAAALAAWITRSVTRPVAAISAQLASLDGHCLAGLAAGLGAAAEGDLTVDVVAVTTPVDVQADDELGRLGTTFNAMLAKAQGAIESYNGMRAQLGALVGDVSRNAGTVSAASQQMASTSDEAGRAVDEIASAVGEVAQGAERQVRMVEDTRNAMQEAARAAGSSSDGAQQTVAAAEQARAVAREGVGAAQLASDAIGVLAESSAQVSEGIQALSVKSERIGGIVGTITGIAEQTNLLALNAAIEAARAGEQGRGFAVVAEEVRKLAEESQSAAAEISGLIGEMQSETGLVVDAVDEAARRTQDSVASVQQTREAFEQIGAAVEDMTARIAQIAASVEEIAMQAQRAESDIGEVAAVAEESSASAEQVSASTQQTSASTQEIAASAVDLARTAEELAQLVARFKIAA